MYRDGQFSQNRDQESKIKTKLFQSEPEFFKWEARILEERKTVRSDMYSRTRSA